MASVERDATRTKTPWVVRWRDEAGRQRKQGFAKKIDADRHRAKVEHQLATGAYIDPKLGRTTLREYGEAWRAAAVHRENTASRTKSQLHCHVYPRLGDRPMAAIRNSELQAFVTSLDLAPSSVRPVWATVRAIFGAAIRDRAIGHDPCLGVKLPELPLAEVVPLLLDQVDALAAAVPDRYRGLIAADAGSGLRQGEIFGLEVPGIDFLRREITVSQQVQPTAGGGVKVCPPKNRYSHRTVPVGQVVVDELAAHLAEFPAEEVEVLDVTGKRPVRRMARFVFTDAAGQPLLRSAFNADVWDPARRAAGVPEATQHDLRHFYASLLIRAGLGPKVVAKLLGHKDASMTLRVYAHLWPDDDDRSRQAIDDAFRRVASPQALTPASLPV
ncbi:tyrosine-type recombinase/integrase [Micromonospora sp. WMMD1120]|uniref:tyrosine-type recombinase/integrase n=1 Tax=Micromonospora sp. WMMD1120 TaxID=3016106 RepID=UPI0024177B84|nr:site-specific integrase [Micromonospora sp. WMMD1120]MDG4809928.1 tyrosine-type recombinase/integrase [Micromonospora sp. WMMD1120]